MTEFASRLNEIFSQPLVPWGILAVIVTGALLGQVGKLTPDDPIDRMKQLFGVKNIPHFLALLIAALWFALVAVLVTGLFTLLYEIVWGMTMAEARAEQGDFRFLLAKTTALTAVLGALVALPFTALRLKLTTQQNRHSEDVLYNDKLHNALDDLHARRQLSGGEWDDDIIRRNGAIDRLEALAVERPVMAPRIARMLCVYLKEMSREFPAEVAPRDINKIYDWAKKLAVKRSDMENAAQVLGRMHDKTGLPPKELAIDLSEVNLQAMTLNKLNFESANFIKAAMDGAELHGAVLNRAVLNRAVLNGAVLNFARLYGAVLNGAELYGAELYGAVLNRAELYGAELYGAVLNKHTELRAVQATAAALRSVDLSMVPTLDEFVKTSFGDASVILPDQVKPLVANKWPDQVLDDATYAAEWELFKKDPAAYVPPQDRSASS